VAKDNVLLYLRILAVRPGQLYYRREGKGKQGFRLVLKLRLKFFPLVLFIFIIAI